MRRTTYVLLCVAALTLLAGCSGIIGSDDVEPEYGDAEFDSTVDNVDMAVVGEDHEMTVYIENIGESEGEADVWYDVGVENYTESVTLDAGESTTVTFTHVFSEVGDHDVTVTGDSVTVTTITLLKAAEQTMAETSSMTAEGEQVVDGVYTVEYDGETRNDALVFEGSFEATYDFDDGAMHRHEVTTGTFGNQSQERTIESWYVDDIRYVSNACVCNGESETRHDVGAVAFADADYLSVEHVLDGLTDAQRQDTGDAYVYTISNDDADAMEAFLDATEEEAPFRNIDGTTTVTSFTVSVTIDSETHHVTAIDTEIAISETDRPAFTGDVEFTIEYDNFDAPTNIAVPDDVHAAVEPDAHAHVMQDGGAVVVEALRLDGATLRIEVEGEPVETLSAERTNATLTDVAVGDEVVVVAEPHADGVFDEEEIERYTVVSED